MPIFAEIVAYSELAVRNNASVVEYCRTSMAALSGGTAGLLGLTGFYGFGFYVFAVVGLWVCKYLGDNSYSFILYMLSYYQYIVCIAFALFYVY